MSQAYKYLPHYTLADYATWEGDWELWQGIPVAMTPSPFGNHQRVAKNLVFELERQIRAQDCSAVVLYEIDWIISDDTVVRPDVLVVCGQPPSGHVEQTPALVAEILSASTDFRDRKAKRELYEEQGVGAYVLVDPDAQTLEVYHRGASAEWSYDSVAEAVQLAICDDCALTIPRLPLFR